MKNKCLLIFICVCVMLSLITGCTADEKKEKAAVPVGRPVKEETKELEVSESPVEYDTFKSMEDFEEYLGYVEPDEGVADLYNLKKYYLPTGIPEGYELYKITAGIVDIGFWYLPVEYLVDEESKRAAEANQKYFLFISPRYDDSIETVFEEEGAPQEKRGENYYFDEGAGSNDLLFWEYDGVVIGMYIPKEITSEYKSDSSVAENYGGAKAVYVERENKN